MTIVMPAPRTACPECDTGEKPDQRCVILLRDRLASLVRDETLVRTVSSMTGSGEQETNHGLTRRQNRYLRTRLVEAAWVAVRHDPTLLQTFLELSRRMKKSQAIVRIAKKLLSRLRYVWMHHTCYRIQGEELETTEHDQ